MRPGRPLALAVLAAALGTGSQLLAKELTILHVSDTHSHLAATGPRDAALRGTVGGIARTTTVLARERAASPATLVLHAGDLFQGDVFFNAAFGVPELQWLAGMGFDAMTVGNHEFDLGPENLHAVLDAAFADGSIPLLSANAGGLDALALGAHVKPHVLRTAGDTTVGIFGLTVADDPLCQNGPVTLDPEVERIAAAEVAALRAAGAEVVVLLSHLGLTHDVGLAGRVDGIDVIVGGHDHGLVEQAVEVPRAGGGTTWVVEAGPYYAHIGRLRLDVSGPGAVRLVDDTLLPVDESVTPDPNVEAMVASLEAGIEQAYGPIFSARVAEARRDVTLSFVGARYESPIGNLVTDAFRAAGKTDLALTTSGLISEGLSKGPLVGADLFRVVSYGYDTATGLGFGLYRFGLTGVELTKALEMGLAGGGPDDPFFPRLSGLSFAFDPDEPAGKRLLPDTVLVGGATLEPDRVYSVTANGAVVMMLPALGVEVTDVVPVEGVFEYTALLDHVSRLGVLDPRVEGRIRTAPRPDRPIIRIDFREP